MLPLAAMGKRAPDRRPLVSRGPTGRPWDPRAAAPPATSHVAAPAAKPRILAGFSPSVGAGALAGEGPARPSPFSGGGVQLDSVAAGVHAGVVGGFMAFENDKAHIARVAPASGTPPAEWRARCPWHFGFAPHRVTTPACVTADPQLWSERCRRCWHGVPVAVSHEEASTSGSD